MSLATYLQVVILFVALPLPRLQAPNHDKPDLNKMIKNRRPRFKLKFSCRWILEAYQVAVCMMLFCFVASVVFSTSPDMQFAICCCNFCWHHHTRVAICNLVYLVATVITTL
ncbi:unnamed protein product [Urochloa humidicola]